MDFASLPVGKDLCGGLRRIVGPDEKFRRNGRKFFNEPPWFRQVIEKTGTEDGIEFSKRGKITCFEVCLREFRISNPQEVLNQSCLPEICPAAFEAEHPVYPAVFRESESVRT